MKMKPDCVKVCHRDTYSFMEFVYNNYFRCGFKVHGERKSYEDYIDQYKTHLKVRPNSGRKPSQIPNTWDDYYSSHANNHPRSWKAYYKIKKQYLKNT